MRKIYGRYVPSVKEITDAIAEMWASPDNPKLQLLFNPNKGEFVRQKPITNDYYWLYGNQGLCLIDYYTQTPQEIRKGLLPFLYSGK